MEDNIQFKDSIETQLEVVIPKRKKILVGVNTLTAVDQAVYSNHCQFWFRLGRNFPDIDFILNNPRRMSIDNMRNLSARLALQHECDYLMFIDDDVVIPIDALTRMLAADKDIIAGWTVIRGYPFENMIFKQMDDGNLTFYKEKDFPDLSDGLLKCDAVGFSCVLIKCELLKKVKPPYFVTGPKNTEDVYFCVKSKLAVPDVSIYVDTWIKTSHNLGAEYIDPLNKELYKKYCEDITPELLKPQEPQKEEPVEIPIDGELTYEDLLERDFKNG